MELIEDALKAETPEDFIKILTRTNDDDEPIFLKDVDNGLIKFLRAVPIINFVINSIFPKQPELNDFEKRLYERHQSGKSLDNPMLRGKEEKKMKKMKLHQKTVQKVQ